MAPVVTLERRPRWWAARSARERWLVLVMLAMAVLVLVWLLVLRPLGDARAAAEERLAAAASDLGRARAEAAMLHQQAPGAAGTLPVPLPLDAFLRQVGGEQGFTNLQVSPDGADGARMAIANARAQPLLAWIGQLEARGVVVESFTARANGDQTVAVDAVLRARAG